MNLDNVLTTVSTIGSVRTFDLHPQQNLIAFDAGFHVVLQDLQTNKKVTVHSHNNSISCIQFVGANNEYILSIDSQSIPCCLLTHWPSQTLVQQHYLSTTIKDSPVLKVKCAYSPQNFLVIAENFKEKYILSLWDFKSDNLSLLASHSEDVLSQCSAINVFDAQPGRYSLFFSVTEKKTIKYWGYNRQKLELVNKIHVKDNIVDSVISPLTQFLLFITEPGKLCIVNKEGQFVSSVSHPMLIYSCLSLYNDYLFLGTVQGDIEIYHLSSLKFAKSLKNLRQLPKKTLSTSPTVKGDYYQAMQAPTEQQGVALEPSKKLVKMGITGSHRVLTLMYEDSQMFFYDFEKGKQIGSITGHSAKIKEIVWDPNSEQTMISCSNDGTLRVWNYTGEGWTSSPIYAGTTSGYARLNEKAREIMPKAIKGDISFRSHKSNDYKFTCVRVLWEENEIYAGDNRGCLCVYDLQTKSLLYEVQIANSKIKRIALGDNHNFIGVVLVDGSSFVLDRHANLRTKIQLEKGTIELGGKVSFFRGIKLLEEEIPTPFLRSQAKLTKTSSVSLLKPNLPGTDFAVTNRTQGLSQIGDVTRKGGSAQLRVLTTCNANSLRLHQISKSQDSLSSLIIANYNVNGKILDFDIHSSKEYLIVLTNPGVLCIFKLGSGELKLMIEVAQLSQRMSLDPSGLYIAVTMPCLPDNKELTTFKRSGKWIPPERTFSFNKKEDDTIEGGFNTDQNAIVLYEIWTGEMIGETKKIQKISCLQFSEEGKRLAVGSVNGQVAVLEVDRSIQANMKGVLEEVKQDPLFWTNFYVEANEPQHYRSVQEDKHKDSEIEDDRESAYYAPATDNKQESVRTPSQQQQDLSVRMKLSERFKEAGTGTNTPSQRSAVLTNKEVQVTRINSPNSLPGLPDSYRDQPYRPTGQDRNDREYYQNNQGKLTSAVLSEPVMNRMSQQSQRSSIVSNLSQNKVGKPSSIASPNFNTGSQHLDRPELRNPANRYSDNEKPVSYVMQGTQYNANSRANLQTVVSEKGVGSMNINDPYPYRENNRISQPSSQGYIKARKIESDPSDIDDNETPGRFSMANYREAAEIQAFNPVSDFQSRYGYSHIGPAAKNYPWEKDTQLSVREHESEDASNVYNDIEEFQKKFMRDYSSNYK